MLVFVTVLCILLLLVVLYLFLIFPARSCTHDPALDVHYAHRGLWDHDAGIPENSLAAFARAADAGFGIELDVQLSADGTVYVFHDEKLARMTGCDKRLSACSSAELDSLRLDGTDERIPRFSEVLSLVGGRVPILVELKGESTDTALCPETDALLAEYRGPYCVESFNPMLLRWYRKHRPEIYRGLLYTNVCREKGFSFLHLLLTGMLLNVLCRPQFIVCDLTCQSAFPVRFCRRFTKAGRFLWTVRELKQLSSAEASGAHGIFERLIPDRMK